MNHPVAEFHEIEALAQFCAALVRQSIMFHVVPSGGTSYRVYMTGY
jgi:hypothetical protein